jgi:hypothetical protein
VQACFDISQALAVGQLREAHRQVLVPAREPSIVRVTSIARHTFLKLVPWQVIDELSENSLADIHASLSAIAPRTSVPTAFRRETFKSKNLLFPLTN